MTQPNLDRLKELYFYPNAHNSTHPEDVLKVRMRRRIPSVTDSRNNIRFLIQYPIESDITTFLELSFSIYVLFRILQNHKELNSLAFYYQNMNPLLVDLKNWKSNFTNWLINKISWHFRKLDWTRISKPLNLAASWTMIYFLKQTAHCKLV